MAVREPLILLTETQAREMITEAVKDAIGDGSPDDSDWIDATQAARMLSVKRDTIRTLVKRDGLPHYRAGKSYTFRRSEIVDWLQARAKKPRAHSAKHYRATIHVLDCPSGRSKRSDRG